MCGGERSRGLQGADGGLRCLCEECCRGDVMRSGPSKLHCQAVPSYGPLH
ncbi:Hypothetical protein SMAX5B_005948 [Scophthalmus maximus]|uniref:Uncharacterized protein n=1 Tax=Scophthalmus maximus TaxID=52904 RepID=A0A2U9CRQ3_SCOMX|nr:Hypothetical protein SMAX5B_005948 [Scophthalmus maximus]